MTDDELIDTWRREAHEIADGLDHLGYPHLAEPLRRRAETRDVDPAFLRTCLRKETTQ